MGRALRDGQVLHECGVTENQTIHLVERPDNAQATPQESQPQGQQQQQQQPQQHQQHHHVHHQPFSFGGGPADIGQWIQV